MVERGEKDPEWIQVRFLTGRFVFDEYSFISPRLFGLITQQLHQTTLLALVVCNPFCFPAVSKPPDGIKKTSPAWFLIRFPMMFSFKTGTDYEIKSERYAQTLMAHNVSTTEVHEVWRDKQKPVLREGKAPQNNPQCGNTLIFGSSPKTLWAGSAPRKD